MTGGLIQLGVLQGGCHLVEEGPHGLDPTQHLLPGISAAAGGQHGLGLAAMQDGDEEREVRVIVFCLDDGNLAAVCHLGGHAGVVDGVGGTDGAGATQLCPGDDGDVPGTSEGIDDPTVLRWPLDGQDIPDHLHRTGIAIDDGHHEAAEETSGENLLRDPVEDFFQVEGVQDLADDAVDPRQEAASLGQLPVLLLQLAQVLPASEGLRQDIGNRLQVADVPR